jgi:O-antigen/teichoic acid export membrane protein
LYGDRVKENEVIGSGELETGKKSSAVRISGSMLARNTLLNLIGQAVPLLVAVIAMPFIVRGLGTERFGLLSLAWVVLGYFTIFDLGLGRATTKYVAEALGKGEGSLVPQIIWTAVTVQAIMGVLGAIVLIGITDLLVDRILNIPPELLGEARVTFYLLALSVPVVLIASSFSGVLEAAQRFDLVNAVRIPSSILTYLLPLVGLSLGLGLPGIVALIVLARFGALVAFAAMNLRVRPELREYSASFILLSRLFAYGGWVTVSSVVSPILVYLDRFLIGSLLTIAAVAYYTAPYEAVTRLSIIAASLTMTLFPAFSALEGRKDEQRLGMFFARSVKYILLATGPVVVVIWLFAGEILQIWLGADFVAESTVAMQILAVGVLINSLALTPYAFLQGVGRPDLPAKFHLIELPIYIGVAWILVSQFGIAGASGAWALRVVLDALLLFGATFKVYGFSLRLLETNGTILASISLVILAGAGYGMKTVAGDLSIYFQFLLVMGLLVLFAWFTWNRVLDGSDRSAVLTVTKWKKRLEIM